MKSRKWISFILAVSMLMPVYAYAAPSLTESSVSSDETEVSYVPVVVNKTKLNSTSWVSTELRNQIGEMAMLQEDGDGYLISLKIGTYSGLDLIQVVKPDKSEEVLELGLTNVKLGDFNVPEGLEIDSKYEPDEQANDYYLQENVTVESYDSEKNTGLVTFPISDLGTPLIIRTVSNENSKKVYSQVLQITSEDKFSFSDISGTAVMEGVWMGYLTNTDASGINKSLADRRGKKSAEDSFFNNAFDNEVKVEKQEDGKVAVTLSVNVQEGHATDEIKKIEIDSTRPPIPEDDSLSEKYYLNDYWANYEEVTINDGKITLLYDSLEEAAMGVAFRIKTNGDIAKDEIQAAKSAGLTESTTTYRFASFYLTEKENENIQKTITDENGVTFTYWTNDYPEGSTFKAEMVNRDFSDTQFSSYTTFAKDYRIYSFTILDENGQTKDSQSPVVITLPVPEDWDLDHIYMITHSDESELSPSRPGTRLDGEARTITLSSALTSSYNGSCLMYDAGTSEDVTAYEDGIYQVKASIASKNDPLDVSMANEAFSQTPAYLEIENGEAVLYAEVGGVYLGTQFGYMSNMFMGNIDSEDREEVTYLDYQKGDDGKPLWLTDGSTYSAYNIKRIKTVLSNPQPADTDYQYSYRVGFYVPIMDGLVGGNPGSGEGAQPAYLRISDVEPVTENPLNSYGTGVAWASVNDAEFYLNTATASEAKRQYVANEKTLAEEEITGWGETSPADELILAVCENIARALNSEPLEEGRYQIPYTEEGGFTGFKSVSAVIDDGKMELYLEKTDSGTMPEIEYRGEYGDYLTDAVVSEEGKQVTITLSYTEAPIWIQMDEQEYQLTLDFENAVLISTDLSAVKALLEEAKGRVDEETLYTANTLKALQTEIEKTETLLEDFDTEQSEADAQKEAIQTALDNLKVRADLSTLWEELADAGSLINDTDYTQSSREELKTVIDDIKEALEDEENISEAEEEEYRIQLSDAIDSLKTGDDEEEEESDGTLKSFLEDYQSWYSEEDFTQDSWSEFAGAMDEALTLSEQELSETESEEAIEALIQARSGLIRRTEAYELMLELEEKLEEIETELNGGMFAGYYGYDALEAAMEASDIAISGSSYLTEEEVSVLLTSLKAQYTALAEEENLEEETVSKTTSYIPVVEIEEELLEGSLLEETTQALEEETVGETEESTEETEESSEEETVESTAEEAEESPEEETAESTAEETEESTEETAEEETEEIAEESTEEETLESSKEETEEIEETEEDSQEETGELKTASISAHVVNILGTSFDSSEYKDGTYYVDYDMYKWDEDKLSMGNAALDYGDELGRMIFDDGVWMLYIRFNKMEYDGIVGELKSMERIVDTNETEDGTNSITQPADYPETISAYPEVLGFITSPDEDEIPVQVNVPLMTAGPIQEAQIKIDWTSLDYINGSTDINSALELGDLEDAIEEAEDLKESAYTSWSWKVLEENITAAEGLMSSDTASQEMLDQRTEALKAAIEALVNVAESEDYKRLNSALLDAYMADQSQYGKNALRELDRTIQEAESLSSASDVTPGMIDMAVTELEEAMSRTDGSGDDDSSDDDGLDYSSLSSLIERVNLLVESDYTESTWKTLKTALEEAREVLAEAKKDNVSQSEIDTIREALRTAYLELVKNTGTETGETVDYKYLKVFVQRAKTLLTVSSKYTDDSVRSLQLEYDLAVTMLEDENLTQEEIDEQMENLRNAINGLVTADSTDSTDDTDDDGNNSGSDEDDGYYEVDVRLWHATMNKASMGDPAISRTAYVQIDDGDITMRMVTKKMTTSGITTHLYDFYIYNDGDYEDAELVSTENSKWIYEFELPNDSSKYYKCKVDPRVDVMGDDPVKARLKVDWDSLDEIDEDDWDDLTGDVDDDDDDNTSSSSSKLASELKSGETGITVKGNAGGPGIVLEASKKENGAELERANTAIGGEANRFILYDINLRSGTQYVQPSGSVTLQIPIPAEYESSKLVLYRINDDGSYVTLTGKVNGSYYEAEVDHFSLYALAESRQVQTESLLQTASDLKGGKETAAKTSRSNKDTRSAKTEGTLKKTADTAQTVDGRVIPYTGDTTPVKELMGVGSLALLICMGLSLSGKKSGKKKENQTAGMS